MNVWADGQADIKPNFRFIGPQSSVILYFTIVEIQVIGTNQRSLSLAKIMAFLKS